MAKYQIKKGLTNQTIYLSAMDTSSTIGAKLTGLVYNAAGLTCYYTRNQAAAVQITLATQTVAGAHSDGGLVLVHDTNAPGLIRLDIPDAVVASGVDKAIVTLKGASNLLQIDAEIRLTDTDNQDGVRYGITALPNAAADAAGGLPISDAGGLDMDAIPTAAEISDAVWDEILSTSSHNIAQSAGKRLRQTGAVLIREETAQGSGTGNNQIQFDAAASATDGAYDPSAICIIGGTGVGQSRLVIEYAGASKTATIDRDWKVNPDNTSEFQILCNPGREHVNEGLAQAGGASTITLNTLASANNEEYKGQEVFIRSGTGQDQRRVVLSYVGATKIATVDEAWVTQPDTTSGYVMLGARASVASVNGTAVDGPDDFKADVSGLSTLTLAQIRTALGTTSGDVMAELTAIPGVTPTLAQGIMAGFQALINEGTENATTRTLKKRDGTIIGTAAVDDSVTTPATFTKKKFE